MLERDLTDNGGRLKNVCNCKPHACDRAFSTVQPLRIFKIDESEASIEFIHPNTVNAANRKSFRARHHTQRRHNALCQCYGHLVADADVEFSGQLNTQYGIETPW